MLSAPHPVRLRADLAALSGAPCVGGARHSPLAPGRRHRTITWPPRSPLGQFIAARDASARPRGAPGPETNWSRYVYRRPSGPAPSTLSTFLRAGPGDCATHRRDEPRHKTGDPRRGRLSSATAQLRWNSASATARYCQNSGRRSTKEAAVFTTFTFTPSAGQKLVGGDSACGAGADRS